MHKIRREAAGKAAAAAFTLLFPTIVLADVAPTPPAQSGFDWVTVVTGAVFGFAGALFFVWLGRKLIKR